MNMEEKEIKIGNTTIILCEDSLVKTEEEKIQILTNLKQHLIKMANS